jgi:putative sterol carrier protein
MASFIYPEPRWAEETVKLYNEELENKLKKLTGSYSLCLTAEPNLGIETDLYYLLSLDAGKLGGFRPVSEAAAQEKADFIMVASYDIWKGILTGEKNFTSCFLTGKVKLLKGSKLGAINLGPYSGILVDMMTRANPGFPDELSAEELAEFKKALATSRREGGF